MVKNDSVDMERVAAIILGGGQGTRLFPLTLTRCKPAISFGGQYRLIDIPMSNSINSGCLKIFIITQFLSASLHHHIFKTYRLGTYSSGFIELLSVEQRHNAKTWYQGPADAVRENSEYFQETPADYFLILSGDQLYNMDYRKMVRFARETDADLVVAALPVNEEEAKRMGVLKLDEDNFVTGFAEKPQEAPLLDQFRTSRGGENQWIGSMGIYLFKRDVLLRLLEQDQREDFGKHLIPTQIANGNVAAYLFDGYWEDIGTIESFYKANMALTASAPSFHLYDERNPIYTSQSHLPAPKFEATVLTNAIVCDGSKILAKEISRSILGPRTMIGKGSVVHDSYIMGNDFYEPPIMTKSLPKELHIGQDCLIQHAIIDKHVCIGNGVQLINKQQLTHYDSDTVYIRDGIIIVTRGATLPDGFTL